MTPAQIVSEVRTLGGRLVLAGDDRIRVEPGPKGVPRRLIDEVRAHKVELIAELQKRETLVAQQHLLQQGRWPPTETVCDLLIGRPGERCPRCGASWLEHYAPADGTSS